MTASRIEYFDIAKGIGILCIIAGHLDSSIIQRIVFTFHVPLFFIISGYFLSSKDSLSVFTKKRFLGLLLPYIFTSICLTFLSALDSLAHGDFRGVHNAVFTTIVRSVYGNGSASNKCFFDIGVIGAIWFLLALFWALLIVKSLYRFKARFLIISLLAIAGYFSSQRWKWLPFDLQAGALASVLVFVGVWFRDKQQKLDKYRIAIMIIGFVWMISEVILGISISIARNHIDFYGLSLLGSIVISLAIIYFSQLLEKISVIKKALVFFGRNSIILLSFHLMELNYFPWSKVANILGSHCGGVISIVCIFAIKIMWGIAAIFIVSRSRILCYVFQKHFRAEKNQFRV